MRFHALAFVSIILAILIAGCQYSTRSNTTEPLAKQSRQLGYIAERRYATTSMHEAWTLAGEPVDMTLVRSSGSGPFPLVIYLPGLGGAIQRWRRPGGMRGQKPVTR
jgi:hypothetical protein